MTTNNKKPRAKKQIIRQRVPSVKLTSGDIAITGRSVKDCVSLAHIGNALRKSAPTECQAGPFKVKGGLKALMFCIGGYTMYKGISFVFSRLSQRLDNSKGDNESDKPKFLRPQKKEPKVVTLNEIGRSSDSDTIPLMGDFFYSGDIVVIFSITNNGKTMMGIQIAKDLAEGSPSMLIPNSSKPKRQNVIYYNFEMREEQLHKRYFGHVPNAVYPENLKIIFCKSSITTIDKLLEDIAIKAESFTSDTTIFIDTIKDVCPVFYAKESDRVIDSLRTICDNAKETNGVRITFVLLGQANKKKPWDPIELDDLSGSYNFAGLADSVFAIGNTNMGKSVRMLKMLKGRNDGIRDLVVLLKTVVNPYLHMEYMDEVEEADALPEPPKAKKGKAKPIVPKAEETKVNPSNIPDELLKEIRAFYQKGVSGHGAKQVVKKFGKDAGLKYPIDVTRLMEKLDKQKEED